ncbi:adenylate/guanylate cyclase domain-containing protein [Jatrophihabitans endophyticus]|uniref:adenylate/guanylate cyclase domain-containing protein n=1 Tax=Jatrophihabitans endophyticus TaxID=1206085 RepID=UPI0019EAE627|nr:adenylate/guanylate cyclase domain-containing protein [Jatrophihabitans endophyticus]MBE7189163.1 adenylate/guanylate cyclase domain-containing protein [Jatrophihabitans endophyticus]
MADDAPTDATADPTALSDLLDRVETSLIGGPRRYTRVEMAQKSGLPIDEMRTYWRALGFAAVDDDQRNFADPDVGVLRRVHELQSVGGFDDEAMLAITRIIGQTFARLASWQGQFMIEMLAARSAPVAGADPVPDPDVAVGLIDELAPVITSLQDWVWRRQLAAYFSRVAANAGAGTGVDADLVVGFVDMAGFTTLTRRSSEAELREVLTAFETLATDVVVSHDGQIVKTIGDEILFTADTPREGALIALDMIERSADVEVLPQLRGGVAFGAVVSRWGDVYGQPVNIASRLTSIARTDSVLVDDVLAGRLADDDGLVLHSMRPVSVRGYRHLKPWRLRRAAPAR